MKEDRTSLQERCKLAEDKNALLETKLKQISEDQTDIFENLRSKVEKSKAYAKVLLDQRDVLEREKKDSIEALQSQLDKKAAHLRHSKTQLKTLKERWQEQQGRMKSAAHTLAVRAEMEERERTLEKQLNDTKMINSLRESQNSIISSVKENIEEKAVAAMLMECLKQFPHLKIVQRESVQSLTKILNLRNCQLIIDSSGIQLVMRAMKEHKEDVTLLAACCRLLWRIYVDADHEQVCKLFALHHTRDVILSVLQLHPSDRHLHYNIVGLFKHMLHHANMFDQRIGHRYQDENKSESRSGSRSSRRSKSGGHNSEKKTMNSSESLPTIQQQPETISPREIKNSSSVINLPAISGAPPVKNNKNAWEDNKAENSKLRSKQDHHNNYSHHNNQNHSHHHQHHNQQHKKIFDKTLKPVMVAKHKQKQWRTTPKKSDVRPIVHILLDCINHYLMEDAIVEKCISVLSILIFDETEKESFNLKSYNDLRSNEKSEAARGLALDVIEQAVPGGEVYLVKQFVQILKTFQSPKNNVLQGMILLMIQKILPEDPEIKTIYIRKFKELGVNNAVFNTLSLAHAMSDMDLRGVGLWILEYFAMPPPGKKKKKKKILDQSLAAEF
jgi:hypothetical protein